MSSQVCHPVTPLEGALSVPGDKSISHRALILSAISEGTVRIKNLLCSDDVGRTMMIMQELGVRIEEEADALVVHGVGKHGLTAPSKPLYCGNSGTTLRLMTGLLAGQNFSSQLNGDASLDARPMQRVIDPLEQMGAHIEEKNNEGRRIVVVRGQPLRGLDYDLPIASAQVKSALMLAGLYANGPVSLKEPHPSRDHTERMLVSMGARLEWGAGWVRVEGIEKLSIKEIEVPNDFSSAAFFIVAALLIPESQIKLNAVLVSPTRSALLDILKEMGGEIDMINSRVIGGEKVADLIVQASRLQSTECPPARIPSMLDEIPILAVAATQAKGTTRIVGAGELRVKETDRLRALTLELSLLGAQIKEQPDGLAITGPTRLKGGTVKSYGDHRMAMALTVAAAVAQAPLTIEDYDAVKVSYPEFLEDWQKLVRN
jgi:3-phosphoshikimate 1-carboxyvinyltransferase